MEKKKAAKALAAVVGVSLIFIGFGIGMAYIRMTGSDRWITLAVGSVILYGGWRLLDFGTGWSKRWAAAKAERNKPKYPPRGGGM